jgi:hypothetical protein
MKEPRPPAPTPEGLAAAAGAAARRGPPPVHLWDPPFCGDVDMRIARDGTWFYAGGPIGRPAMVRLFASILKREGDRFFLVTPVEKVGIVVEDAPFVAVDVRDEGGRLVFATDVGDEVTAGPDHALRPGRDAATGAPVPYLHVRRGLEARVDRKTFYRLVERGETRDVDGTAWFGVSSGDAFFPLAPAAELGG